MTQGIIRFNNSGAAAVQHGVFAKGFVQRIGIGLYRLRYAEEQNEAPSFGVSIESNDLSVAERFACDLQDTNFLLLQCRDQDGNAADLHSEVTVTLHSSELPPA